MQSEHRMATTIVIWIAFAAMVIFTPAISGNFITVAMIGTAAGFSTLAVWNAFGSDQKISEIAQTEKAKLNQRERVARLVSQMDDEEVAELGSLLSGHDEVLRR